MNTASVLAFIFGISLFSVRVAGTPILVSDLALVLAVFTAFASHWQVQINRPALLGIALLVLALLSGVSHSLWLSAHFSELEFALSSVRLGLGVLALMTIPAALREIDSALIARCLVYSIRLHVYTLVAIEAVAFVFAIDVAHVLSLPSIRQTDWGLDVRRASGLFTEPSFFAIYIALAMFAVLDIERSLRRAFASIGDYIMIAFAIALSTSFTGLIIFLVLCAARLRIRLPARKAFSWRVPIAGVFLLSTAAIFQFTEIREHISNYIEERFVALTLGEDSSANDRIQGSLEVAAYAFDLKPLIGVGLGQEQMFIARNEDLFPHKGKDDNEGHIAPLNALTTIGLGGGLLFGLLIIWFVVNRPTRNFGMGLLLVCFAWGGFLSATIWAFMALAIGVSIGGQQPLTRASRS